MASAVPPAIRVFLLDDHDVVRRGFRELLELEAPSVQVVGEAASVAGAIEMAPPLKPDVAILDIRLQDGTGIDACRQLRELAPRMACLIFTPDDGPSYSPDDRALYEAVRAGASGWVAKHAVITEVVEAIRVAAAGVQTLDTYSTARLIENLRHQESPLSWLTQKERRILRLIGDGLSNRAIAKQTGLAEKTVKNYISRIFEKLGVNSRTQAVAWAHARSYAHRAYENIKDA